MEHYELLRQLREERGLSQEELSEGIASRSALSYFENGAKSIKFDVLLQYLERMNVTIEEFSFLLNLNCTNLKKEYCDECFKGTTASYSLILEEKYLALYQKTTDFYYYYLYAVYYLVSRRNSSAIGSDKLKIAEIKAKIMKYLDKINSWGQFEFSVFINLLFLFNDEFIYHSFKNSVKKMNSYTSSTYYSRDLSAFLRNGLQLSFERGSDANYQLFRQELMNLNKLQHDAKNTVLLNLFDHLKNDKNNAQKRTQLLEILNFLEMNEWTKYLN